MQLHALFLNCTLKRSPEVSNTQALIDKVAALLAESDVDSETIRVVDHAVKFGVLSDEGDGDGWPMILERPT